MKKIAVCIPTLVRYDLLGKALLTAETGTLVPDEYWIVDNGNRLRITSFPDVIRNKVVIMSYGYNLGVAASWNKFIERNKLLKTLGDEKVIIICNDDVEFYPETIQNLLDSYDEKLISYPGGAPSANSFSCFMIPETVYEAVGLFDEDISPRYAYFEDNDYHYRMRLLGFDIKGIENCRLGHVGSATVNSLPEHFKQIHHGKFSLARENYIKKWGGQPSEEKYTTPFNR